MPLAWDSRAAALFARLPLFSAIRPAMPPARRRPGDMRDRWRRAAGVDRTPLIEAYLREEIARILRLDPLSLEDTAPLATFGLDSLTGMELRDRVTADLAVAIPMTTFVRGPSLRELAAAIGIELRTAEEGNARDSTDGDAVPNAGAIAPDLVPRVDDLSEAEIDSLLADLMSNPSNRPSSGEAP
jgi:acyl carrier protein